MQPTIAFPVDLAAFIAVLVNPITMGILLSLLIEHVPFMADSKVANWIKAAFAIFVCLFWALLVTVLGPNGLPANPSAWYGVVILALAVAFSNQAFYQIWSQIPCLRDFILQVFGKLEPGKTG